MADNDFFGVQQVTSQYSEEKEPTDSTSKPSGSEFLDDLFFPEIASKSKPILDDKDDDSTKLTGTEYIDDQFFGISNRNTSTGQIEDAQPRKASFRTKEYNPVHMIDEPVVKFEEVDGKERIFDMIIPVWKFDSQKLVQLMSDRVVYNSDELIVFDKPYQMAYSGAPKDQAQLDRILQDLKRVVAPKVDRLHLIKSLDKGCSGLVMFAKSIDGQKKYQEMIKNGKVEFEYRTIVKNVPSSQDACINIPLHKFAAGQDFEMRPLIKTTKDKVYHVKTNYSVITNNNRAHCAFLRVLVNNEVPHQIRSHLAYGINCPILGDKKYNTVGKDTVQTLSDRIMTSLEINKNQARKLPMFLHLKEIFLDGVLTKNKFNASIVAPLPEYFKFVQKRLGLLRR